MGVLFILAAVLGWQSWAHDPCTDRLPSMLYQCGALPEGEGARERRGLDAYMRHEFGVLNLERRHVHEAYRLTARDLGELIRGSDATVPEPRGETVETVGGASCLVAGIGCQ